MRRHRRRSASPLPARPPPRSSVSEAAPAGSIVEQAPAREALAAALARRIAADGGAALIVDYGHDWPGIGDTLQAVRRHRPHGVLDDPGDADLTAHVDFFALAAAARRAGACAFGPVPQGGFLEALGIEARAARLRRDASAAQRDAIDAALRRLTGADAMGLLFKALAIAPPGAGGAARLRGAPGAGGSAVIAPISHALLEDPGGRIRHGFFGRAGGVSNGLYRSLNCGYGSGDDPEAVAENRARAMSACGLASASLCTAYQVHSAEALVVSAPWPRDEAPRVDAMATATPGLALAILTADCVPVLLADREAGVIGAAHAGWRGALNGVVEAAVDAMLGLGAQAKGIRAVIGPAIGPASYEVGPEFPAPFLARDPQDKDLFVAGGAGGALPLRHRALRRAPPARPRPRGGGDDGRRHLRRGRALLQLPPERPPERAGLRTKYLHRGARRLECPT